MARCSEKSLSLTWRLSLRYEMGVHSLIGEKRLTMQDWKISVAGLTPICSTWHSNNPKGTMMHKIFLDSAHSGKNNYPMLKSMPVASVKPPNWWRVFSIVSEGNLHHSIILLNIQKSITSHISPIFFLGTPKTWKVHLFVLHLLLMRLYKAPISHCLSNLCFVASRCFNQLGMAGRNMAWLLP